MPSKYKPGDLVILNHYGLFITIEYEDKIGIIISEAYNILPNDKEVEENSFYIVYDVLLNDELINMIPEEFLDMLEFDEESNDG